jgi:hypothetical protein
VTCGARAMRSARCSSRRTPTHAEPRASTCGSRRSPRAPDARIDEVLRLGGLGRCRARS